MTQGQRSERQWWKFRDTGVKIQDIHDDSGGSSGTQRQGFRTFTMTEWKFRDTGVKIQDIHDDRVKVPRHRGRDSGHSR